MVELYLTKPYTRYDRLHGVEKSAVELVGFVKTKVLAPGESETVRISIERDCLGSYDAYDEKTYLAEAGTYTFHVSKNAHEPLFSLDWELAADERFDAGPTGYEITNRFETER